MLTWNEDSGYGHYPVKVEGRPYDGSYFDKYRKLADTPMGHALTDLRVKLVNQYYRGVDIIDVGIGSGQFVKSCEYAKGYDVNPVGIRWLESEGLYADMYAGKHDVMTFWDSLEHIDDISKAVSMVERYAFVSLPIFESESDVLGSKHFRPSEHIHYFTVSGIIRRFEKEGFTCLEYNQHESNLGREGIGTFVFKRKPV